jgi:hypothetical protein
MSSDCRMQGLTAFSVHNFLAWRLWRITGSPLLTGIVTAGALTAFGNTYTIDLLMHTDSYTQSTRSGPASGQASPVHSTIIPP